MPRRSPIRCCLAATMLMLAGFSTATPAQTAPGYPAKPSAAVSTLPPAQPTTSTTADGQGQHMPPPAPAPHRVEVDYVGGKLSVQATNASLNEVLRDVAKKTGMKITGGVADDRVFGSYGPSSPSVVLDALLEGSGSNILLIEDAKGGSELVLTPRHGGVTPPNPNAAQSNDSDDSNGNAGQYVPPIRPYQPYGGNRGVPPNFPPESQIGAPGGQGNPSGNDGDPRTPQQIYDQLQRSMQQQKQAPNAPPD